MREYRMSKGYRVFCYLVVLASFVAAGLFFYHAATTQEDDRAVTLWVGTLFVVLGSLLVWEIRAMYVTLDEYELTMRSAFITRRIPLTELKGYRAGDNNFFFLVLRSGKRRQLTQGIERREELIDWIVSNYPDLDALDLRVNKKGLLEDERLGLTREDREARLAKTRRFTRGANIAGAGIAVWFYFFPFMHELAMTGAFLAPLFALVVIWRSNGFIKFYSEKTSPYPSVGLLIGFPIFAILWKALFDYNIYAFPRAAWIMLVGGMIALFLLIALLAREAFVQDKKKGAFVFVAIVAVAIYASSTLILTNGHFDHSQPQVWSVRVTDKYETHGTITSYYLKVSPWANYDTSAGMDVGSRFYKSVNTGDSIRVMLKPGKWGIPWYYLVTD